MNILDSIFIINILKRNSWEEVAGFYFKFGGGMNNFEDRERGYESNISNNYIYKKYYLNSVKLLVVKRGSDQQFTKEEVINKRGSDDIFTNRLNIIFINHF